MVSERGKVHLILTGSFGLDPVFVLHRDESIGMAKADARLCRELPFAAFVEIR
jgi:hypothetical protein